jgi:next-to-BRCA1 protein 1
MSVAPVTYGVSCNNCNGSVPYAHYHCSTCDDGDFDLCQSCIDQGITCYSDDHWLIKRTVVDGHIIKSSTEKISPKPKPKPKPKASKPEPQLPSIRYPICAPPFGVSSTAPAVPTTTCPATLATLTCVPLGSRRTCNTCLNGNQFHPLHNKQRY